MKIEIELPKANKLQPDPANDTQVEAQVLDDLICRAKEGKQSLTYTVDDYRNQYGWVIAHKKLFKSLGYSFSYSPLAKKVTVGWTSNDTH